MNVYFISGMGADSRVFQYITLPDGFSRIHLDWIQPLRHETLKDYALRLAEGIDKENPFILIGVSMGGMIAVEIARHFSPVQTIIISSASAHKEFSPFYRFVKRTGVHKLVPVRALKSLSVFKRRFTKEDKETKDTIRQMIRDSDDVFLKWAIPAVLNWENTDEISTLCHIHGTRDEILNPRYIKATHWVRGGTHMMILVNAKEINELIRNQLFKTGG